MKLNILLSSTIYWLSIFMVAYLDIKILLLRKYTKKKKFSEIDIRIVRLVTKYLALIVIFMLFSQYVVFYREVVGLIDLIKMLWQCLMI